MAWQELLMPVRANEQVLDARLTAAHELSSGRAADLDVEYGFRVPASAPCSILKLQGHQRGWLLCSKLPDASAFILVGS